MTDKYRPLKDAFGRFATGITIAGCINTGGDAIGITVNSFTSVSLEPPLVLWCIETKASAYPAFMAADAYSISVLRSDQRDYSDRFARHDGSTMKTGEFDVWESGAPVLRDRLAAFDCKIVTRHKAGDHVILVGEVLKFESHEGHPLIYFASNYYEGV